MFCFCFVSFVGVLVSGDELGVGSEGDVHKAISVAKVFDEPLEGCVARRINTVDDQGVFGSDLASEL